MIVLAALIVAVAAVAMFAWSRLSGVLRARRKSPVIVTLKSGAAFKGVLAGDDARALVLSGAETLEDAKPIPVDGEVIVPWADVKYLQRL